jgi:hypothetical protein
MRVEGQKCRWKFKNSGDDFEIPSKGLKWQKMPGTVRTGYELTEQTEN